MSENIWIVFSFKIFWFPVNYLSSLLLRTMREIIFCGKTSFPILPYATISCIGCSYGDSFKFSYLLYFYIQVHCTSDKKLHVIGFIFQKIYPALCSVFFSQPKRAELITGRWLWKASLSGIHERCTLSAAFILPLYWEFLSKFELFYEGLEGQSGALLPRSPSSNCVRAMISFFI